MKGRGGGGASLACELRWRPHNPLSFTHSTRGSACLSRRAAPLPLALALGIQVVKSSLRRGGGAGAADHEFGIFSSGTKELDFKTSAKS